MIEDISKGFAQVYGGDNPEFVSRAGGRVELIGGHTDYNEGFVLAAAIDKSCFVAASKRADNRVCIYSQWAQEKHEFEVCPGLQPDSRCLWANYGRGIIALLLQEKLPVTGANLYVSSSVPVGGGLSSSAALEVSLAKAILHLSEQQRQIEPVRLARICQKAENIYANSPCGIMDQVVSLMSKEGSVLMLDCRDLGVEYLPFDSRNFSLMIFNSMIRHEIGSGSESQPGGAAVSRYGLCRQHCRQAAEVLNREYPLVKALRDADAVMLNSVKNHLEPTAYSRARHVIDENGRVAAAAKALRESNMAEFGRLMSQSHCSARDLFGISCPEVDFLVEQISGCDAAYGARISGGGFGGSVVALVAAESAQQVGRQVHQFYENRFGIDSEIYTVKPAGGAEIIELG